MNSPSRLKEPSACIFVLVVVGLVLIFCFGRFVAPPKPAAAPKKEGKDPVKDANRELENKSGVQLGITVKKEAAVFGEWYQQVLYFLLFVLWVASLCLRRECTNSGPRQGRDARLLRCFGMLHSQALELRYLARNPEYVSESWLHLHALWNLLFPLPPAWFDVEMFVVFPCFDCLAPHLTSFFLSLARLSEFRTPTFPCLSPRRLSNVRRITSKDSPPKSLGSLERQFSPTHLFRRLTNWN